MDFRLESRWLVGCHPGVPSGCQWPSRIEKYRQHVEAKLREAYEAGVEDGRLGYQERRS